MSRDGQDHDRVSELFLRAVEMPAAEREAWLLEACKDRPELLEEVRSLLEADRDAPPVLKSGVLQGRIAKEIERPPERIGGCRVLEKIGEGGMGVVYRAEQESPVRRQVAIKLIKRGFETRRVVARFESERQAMARMSHPGITQVFDAGVTEDGRPYITMELVDGVPITKYCDRKRQTLEERLRLFIEVCAAVQHAHQKAVIHRDIKPSNILVTTRSGRPLPKIIDFGVAKAIERRPAEGNLATEIGQLVGTPEFMSPEQAETGDAAVDTRTDVYSLGVVLYELLVGAQPFDSAGLRRGGADEIRRRIREEEPPHPSARLSTLGEVERVARERRTDPRTLLRSLRQDLDWITLRALEKDPDRRYGSPGELAEDLRRLLREEPVHARPPSRVYRLRKFVRKHRVGVGFAATVALFLLFGAAAMTVQFRRIAAERNRADVAALQAQQKADAALQVSDFLVGVFDLSQDRDAARRQLDAALDKLENDLRVPPGDRARLLYPLGQIYDNLGFESGAPLMRRAMDELEAIAGPDDPEVLGFMHARGVQLAGAGELEGAAELLDRVRNRRRQALGDDHRDTIGVTAHLGRVREMQGRLDEAESLLFDALDRSRRELGAGHPVTLVSAGYAANLRMRQGRLDDAEKRFREVLEILSRSAGPEHPTTLACLYKLGCVRAQQGDLEQALSFVRRAVDGGWRVEWSEGSDVPTHVALRDEEFLAPLLGHPEFERLTAEEGYLAALERARRAGRAREFDEALRQLELAAERGFDNPGALLRDDALAPMFGDRRFESILARMRERQ